MIIAGFKLASFTLLMTVFIIHHSLLVLMIWDQSVRSRLIVKSISTYSKMAHFCLGIKVTHSINEKRSTGSLIVANHLSYVDILILAARYPSFFITSTEIKETFLLGHITKLAGCFFVERRKRKIKFGTKEREMAMIRSKLDQGFNVFLFPEGTSSDGKGVLPFKATFFQLATDMDIPVVPVTLKYKGKARDIVPWYGPMTFASHLVKVCRLTKIEAHVTELESIYGGNKFDLAARAQTSISECYG